jgi:RNA polymerase sigma-70 factor (ECF subfamily)
MRSDEELAEAFRLGDDGAFSALYERYHRSLYVYAARMLDSGEAARDLVQDVFLGLYERRHGLQRLRSFRGWLFTAGRNRCLTLLRREATRARLTPAAPEPVRDLDLAGLEAGEEARLVRRALAALTHEQREALVLREYHDLSYREIAEITETTESAVKSKLFKARKALHAALHPALAGRS